MPVQIDLTPQAIRAWLVLFTLTPRELRMRPQSAVAEAMGITRSCVNRYFKQLFKARAIRKGSGNGVVLIKPHTGSALFKALHSTGPIGIVPCQ